MEREFQQLIERENNSSSVASSTDYFITDIEYASHANHSRFDILAVKWISRGRGIHRNNPEKATLSFIEVKYGDKALKGAAGICDHVTGIVSFLSTKGNKVRLVHEATSLFNQKYELGLMKSAPGKVAIQEDSPFEFILLVGNHTPSGTVLDDELRQVLISEEYERMRHLGCTMKIATASLLGYGLYDECIIPLEDYLEC